MSTLERDFKGVVVISERWHGDDTFHVSVHDQRRIAAIRDAARNHLSPRDDVLQTLERAVANGFPDVELPPAADDHEVEVLVAILEDVKNGNDGAPQRAARFLLESAPKSRPCPYCDGTGELHD